jgi:hypothetical protein
MGSVKGKCNSKRAEKKEFMEISFGKRVVYFSAKKCCRRCAKSHVKKKGRQEMLFWGKRYANDLCQRRWIQIAVVNFLFQQGLCVSYIAILLHITWLM